MDNFLLSYDTVTLYPKCSRLPTRDMADTTASFLGKRFSLPVIPANMKDVLDFKTAKYLSENNYCYIYHRFGEYNTPITPTHSLVAMANEQNWKLISISVGIHDKDRGVLKDMKSEGYRIDFITIDVAHAHHTSVQSMAGFVKENFPKSKLIIGNIATDNAARSLKLYGADAVKVGIGGGSICTTRYMTGFHIPTLQSVWDVYNMEDFKEYHLPIIADGGAKHYGDVAKAIRFGADMVMAGGWFASCIDSPAQIVDGKKVYRGSTSYELKGHKRHVEGRQLELDGGTTYEQRLIEIKEAIQSSISYSGGEELLSIRNVEYGRIFPFH